MSRQWTSMGLKAVVACGVLLALGAPDRAEGGRDSGIVLLDQRGFGLSAAPRPGDLSRVRVRFDRGYEVRPRSSDRPRTFGQYEVVYGDKQLFGWFMLPEGRVGRRITFQARRDAGAQTTSDLTLRGELTTGKRPVMTITGFPPGATRFDFVTSAEGKRASRMTGPCRDKKRRARGSLLISLRDGGRVLGKFPEYALCGLGKGVKDHTGG